MFFFNKCHTIWAHPPSLPHFSPFFLSLSLAQMSTSLVTYLCIEIIINEVYFAIKTQGDHFDFHCNLLNLNIFFNSANVSYFYY